MHLPVTFLKRMPSVPPVHWPSHLLGRPESVWVLRQGGGFRLGSGSPGSAPPIGFLPETCAVSGLQLPLGSCPAGRAPALCRQ